jgi:hypothetical protein
MKYQIDPTNPLDMVIRPAGVWDTRAPRNKFVEYHRVENQTYWGLILSLCYVSRSLGDLPQENKLNTIFSQKNRIETEALKALKSSFPSDNVLNEKLDLTIGQLTTLSKNAISVVTEYAMVSYYDTFESFLQCWALNYLLAKLENGIKLTEAEKDLNRRFSPRNRNENIPGTSIILAAFPEIKAKLKNCPHILEIKSGNTKLKVTKPITPNLNAFETITFWRRARNLLVHKDALVSRTFYKDFKDYWSDLTKGYPYAPNFIENRRFILNHHAFRPMTTAHYVAAKCLRDILVELSSAKRGHALAPNPEYPGGKVPPSLMPKTQPPMLVAGDHTPSFRWTHDIDFRKSFDKQ